MTLTHAIYGSTTGLGDFRILAATPRFDERLGSTIIYYSNLEGSARSTEFAPIFSFYAAAENVWVFSRTLCLGPTPRGNDYLVHAIVLDAAALATLDFKPFALEDARLFARTKPIDGTVLQPLPPAMVSTRAFTFDDASIASCIRSLASGPLRLRIADGVRGAEVCREIHESLPPDDRLATTFCTRFSYGRNLGFRLAAFAPEDEGRVRETAPNAALTDFLPAAATSDAFDRWTAEVRRQADLDLVGLSVTGGAKEALALIDGVRRLRLWTSHGGSDITHLENAAALVLRRENREREVVRSVLAGALAVDLTARVRRGEAFGDCAQLCEGIDPKVRREAVQWIRELQATPAEAWMAEVLLLLPDGSQAEVTEALQRTAKRRPMLAELFKQSAGVFRAFLATVLARLRGRFGAEGASVAAAVVPQLTGDRDAVLAFVRVMEETALADADRGRQTAWLLAIVRDLFAKASLAAAIPARIILTAGLLPVIDDAEIETFAPAFLVVEEKLAAALAATAATERPRLYHALVNVVRLRLAEGWTLASPSAVDVVRRVLVGGSEVGVPASQLTIIAFLAATVIPAQDLLLVIERLVSGGVSDAQAALLLRVLQRISRRGGAVVNARRETLRALCEAAGKRAPANVWSRLSWYLRLRTLAEVAR